MKLIVKENNSKSDLKYNKITCDFTDYLDSILKTGKYGNFEYYCHYIWQDINPYMNPDGTYSFTFRVPGHSCGSITVDKDETIIKITFIDYYSGAYDNNMAEIYEKFIGQKLDGILIF